MRLVILGPPGAGKGTQAEKLSEKYGIPHISTGDLFRANISEGTQLGVEAKKYMDAGELVPSSVTVDMVRSRLDEPDAVNGFILDGFPRSTDQADSLAEILVPRNEKLDAVISFEVPEDTVVERMLARGRADDTEEVIRNRMQVYAKQTAPLLDYYGDFVTHIDAVGTVDEVLGRVTAALDK
ncbi:MULTISPECIES: adenylate kinase [Tsukamurella]|uniref:Adenylate kinase n=1 Tax=Tsukamurella strandjordii TaxID=147577 RepID=A0AA90NGK3_9ACTN|nr:MULTISPECIES: adenylate kinase [Tsukamurella]MDP0398069.1 adenylate kinase [Tsukamurella strandjordii]GIZ98102.1 adenylate kinase [Tsukamurella sp. TY48]